jgi:hypothetical protein
MPVLLKQLPDFYSLVEHVLFLCGKDKPQEGLPIIDCLSRVLKRI